LAQDDVTKGGMTWKMEICLGWRTF